MKYINLRSCLLVAILLWFVNLDAKAQLIPTPTQVKEIQDKLDKIKELKNNGKKDNDPEIKQLANDAIKLADSFYKIPPANLDGEPEYDPEVEGDGESSLSGKKVKVKIGPEGLSSPGWLASTKSHEIVGHGGQAADSPSRWYLDPKGANINEVEAYDLEIKQAQQNGLSQAEIDELKKRRKSYYDSLDAANRAKVDSQKYTLALAPATTNSIPTLGTSSARLYVVSTVLAEDRMLVTIRKPGNLTNLLITVTISGRSATARTDAGGHAILDFSIIATGITVNTNASISCTDINGSRLAFANTIVKPGFAWAFDRATSNNIPTDISNGTVTTIRGSNLGADAQLACNGRMQETLAASSDEMIVFMDAPLGQGPAFIIGTNGVSESKPVLVKPSTNPVFQALQEQPLLIGSTPSQKAADDATKKATAPPSLGTNRK